MTVIEGTYRYCNVSLYKLVYKVYNFERRLLVLFRRVRLVQNMFLKSPFCRKGAHGLITVWRISIAAFAAARLPELHIRRINGTSKRRRVCLFDTYVCEMDTSNTSPNKKVLTLLMVVRDGKVLLGEKKRGFGAGFFNGFGGKVESGETVEEATLRELEEEAGIKATDASKRGIVTFNYDDQPRAMEVHIYHASRFTGEPVETEEMRPQWFDVNEVPFDKMWPDDEHWYPLFLGGRKFEGTFWFTNTTKIVKHELREVDALPV